MKVVVSK